MRYFVLRTVKVGMVCFYCSESPPSWIPVDLDLYIRTEQCVNGNTSCPERPEKGGPFQRQHSKRRVTQHDCLPSLLDDGDKQRFILRERKPSTTACPARWEMGTKELKKCMVRKKNFLNWADKSSQGRRKISCTDMTSPSNQSKKDLFHLYSLSLHSLSFNSHLGPPLSSLSGDK